MLQVRRATLSKTWNTTLFKRCYEQIQACLMLHWYWIQVLKNSVQLRLWQKWNLCCNRQRHDAQCNLSATQSQLHVLSYTASATRPQLHSLSYTSSAAQPQQHSLSYTASATQLQLHNLSYTASVTQPQLHSLSYTTSATQPQLHGLRRDVYNKCLLVHLTYIQYIVTL